MSPQSTITEDRYMVISSDTHAGPPAEIYREYLEPRHRSRFDEEMVARSELQAAQQEVLGGSDFAERWEEETGGRSELAAWDAHSRDVELDREGVAGEVIFPDADVLGGGTSAPFGAGLSSSGDADGELLLAGARAHNRWLADLCSTSPERRCGVATVPILHDLDSALEEISWLSEKGFRALMIPTLWGSKPAYHDPRYEPVWTECAARGMVVHVHSGGASRDISPGPGMLPIYTTEAWWWAARPMWVLLWAGVFDRHPDLRFVLTEDGAWWLPGILKRMDEKWAGFHNTAKFADVFRKSLARKPSEYFGTNIFIGASTPSREEVCLRHEIGVRTFLWGNDFPHPEGTWPHTRMRLSEAFFDVPVEEARRMLGENAAEVYRFDRDKLAALAERVGPTIGEVGSGPDPTL